MGGRGKNRQTHLVLSINCPRRDLQKTCRLAALISPKQISQHRTKILKTVNQHQLQYYLYKQKRIMQRYFYFTRKRTQYFFASLSLKNSTEQVFFFNFIYSLTNSSQIKIEEPTTQKQHNNEYKLIKKIRKKGMFLRSRRDH